MRIAVVHDYFTQMGGAERVAQELVSILPGAKLHTTVALRDFLPAGLAGEKVVTSWMQYLPSMRDYYRLYFPLYPLGVRSLDLSNYDLVVSSTSGYAKAVRTHPDAIHVCYCHTPMRWAWSVESYASREPASLATRWLLPAMMHAMRRWDKGASNYPDHFVANSKTVAARIQRVYGRTAHVIHPPIDTSRFRPTQKQDDYYLVLSRLISYKRIDLAIEACGALGRRLVVIGDGPERARLMANAPSTVTFLSRISDAEVEHYAARCRALIFPGEEDFGMAPVELAAAGRPTIAYRAGGATETIIDGVTGVFFDRQTAGDVIEAIKQFEQHEWPAEVLRNHAEKFGSEVFKQRFLEFLAQVGAPLTDETGAKPSQAGRARSFAPDLLELTHGVSV